ncbi:MAG: efflux RND transporter periplasmic adaptor subunit [Bacteroidales bacterium]|jgi:HlyD family secretion protein|nr:efflux RND transporter periplasmic adaptor subunit [Bacteroidales bacterium]
MKHFKIYLWVLTLSVLSSCKTNSKKADAYGNFEAVETVVSAETAGKIMKLEVEEGKLYEKDMSVGLIDTTAFWLQKEQMQSQKEAIRSKLTNLKAQLKVLDQQLKNTQADQTRIHQLFEKNAATSKQKDDIDGAVDLIKAQQQALVAQFDGIEKETQVVDAQIALLNDNIRKAKITQPITGTVLAKYAEIGEIAAPGKPLYKTADLHQLELKAYITGNQLADFVLGKQVNVLIDATSETIELQGIISWIASSAEFTPKTIQTKEERTDLVYAIKVRVGNDGRLKIGMPGEVHLINH